MAASPEFEFVSTRVFNAPRQLIYRAWTEPEHLAVWWGPAGFTNTFEVFDLQPGGKWIFTMHGPDGTNYANDSTFLKITANEELIWDHISPPVFRFHITFEDELGEKTKVIFRMIFATEKGRDNLMKVALTANEQNFDRLAAELIKMTE